MRKANKSEEVQMTSNVGRTFLMRPRVPFDDLLEEGVLIQDRQGTIRACRS